MYQRDRSWTPCGTGWNRQTAAVREPEQREINRNSSSPGTPLAHTDSQFWSGVTLMHSASSLLYLWWEIWNLDHGKCYSTFRVGLTRKTGPGLFKLWYARLRQSRMWECPERSSIFIQRTVCIKSKLQVQVVLHVTDARKVLWYNDGKNGAIPHSMTIDVFHWMSPTISCVNRASRHKTLRHSPVPQA